MSSSQGLSHRKSGPSAAGTSSGPEGRGERRVVSPFRCRVWTQHSRPEEQLTEDACRSLRESIAKNGQHQPALGRPVTDDPDYDIEIICGARRHAATLALGQDLIVEVRMISDAEAYVAMYEENVERKDDCPYVQGLILRRALLSKAYSSQDQLAGAFSISPSRLSRLLMVAQLPSIIVAAFQSPHDIRESWGVDLYQRWKDEDPGHTIAGRARDLTHREPRPSAREVYETLIAAPGGQLAQHRLNRSIPVYGASGAIVFREQDQVGAVTFTVPKTILSAERREALTRAILDILDTPTSPSPSSIDGSKAPQHSA